MVGKSEEVEQRDVACVIEWPRTDRVETPLTVGMEVAPVDPHGRLVLDEARVRDSVEPTRAHAQPHHTRAACSK